MAEQKQRIKYKDVVSYLLNYILENNLKDGDRLPTEKELTQRCNVSRITIQRALRELQDQHMIYRIQGGGTYVRGGTSHTNQTTMSFIPVITQQANVNNRFIEVIQGVENFLSQHSYYATVHSPTNYMEERRILSELINKNVPCLIVVSYRAHENTDFYFDLFRKKVPIIFIDYIPKRCTGNLVASNNAYGGYIATRHLLDQGYRNIAFLGRYNGEPSVDERLQGYRHALEEAGIDCRKDYICLTKDSVEPMLDTMLQMPDRPDAFFCVNDVLAVRVSNLLTRRGLSIPDDMALMGFDNLDMAASQAVPISTVHQDFFRMGYYAAELALETIHSNQPDVFCHKIVPVKLVSRNSTLPKRTVVV